MLRSTEARWILPTVRVAQHTHRSIATIIEIVGYGVVGGCAVVGQHGYAIVSVVTTHAYGGIGGVGIAIDVAGTGGTAAERAGVRTVMRRDVSAVAAGVAAHRPGLGGNGGGQDHGGEGEFGQSFHIFSLLFVVGGDSF